MIEAGTPLRVTKGKGKWLKVEIKNRFEEIHPADVDLFLLNSDETPVERLFHTEDEGVSIENVTECNEDRLWGIDIELKLDRVCSRLHFEVLAKTSEGIVRTKSIEFSAHNNGKNNSKYLILIL